MMASASDAEQSVRKSKSKRPSLFKRKGTSAAVPGAASSNQPSPGGAGEPDNIGDDAPERPAQLDFTQAMDDFQLMFPTMERDVIETVLRANNGLVDPTINQLLTMTATNEDEDVTSSSSEDEVIDHISHPHVQPGGRQMSGGGHRGWTSSSDEEEAPPGYAAAVAPPPLPPRQSSISAGGAAAALTPPPLYSPSYGGPLGGTQKKTYTRNWNPPLLGELPHDFLRISVSCSHQHPPHQHPHQQRPHREHPHSQQPHSQQHYRDSRQDSSAHRYNQRQSSDMNSAVLRQISENEKRIAHLERKKSVECSSGISSENYQKLDDEVLARYLQNQEFLAMLRGNEEFMATLNQGSPDLPGSRSTRQRPGVGGIFRGAPQPPAGAQPLPDGPQVVGAAAAPAGLGCLTTVDDAEGAAFPYGMPLPKDEEAELKEKLKHMDNPSRRMFLKMANFFHAHKRRRPEQMLGGSTPATAYLLPDPGGDDDDDDDQLLVRDDHDLPSPPPGAGGRP